MNFTDRLIHGWNAFLNKDPTPSYNYGPSYSSRPDRLRLTRGNDKNLVSSVYNRISLDAAQCDIQHVRLDENDRFLEQIDSGLNYCLTCSPNIDQTGRALIQDIVMSMLDEGCVAVVPVDTDINPARTDGGYDIKSLRAGRIVEWYPSSVKVRLYNEKTGNKEEIILSKSSTAIIENPYYAVMNEPNSTAKRLLRKLSLLDLVDEQNGAGKLDLIIQLPYVIKTEARRQQAETRRKDIEMQLSGSKYGIAYTDGAEHITQLNRSVDNQLLTQIETLTRTLYSQLGITEEIMNGTADEKTMNNYYSRTIEPILSAIVDEMNRKFLTKTARTRKQSIEFFRDPFKLVPTSELAELADKFTRNEIMTSNEFRQVVGMRPSKDPNADTLRNKNLSQSNEQTLFNVEGQVVQEGTPEEDSENEEVDHTAELQNIYDEQYSKLEDLDVELDSLEKMLKHSNDSDNYLVHYASKYYDPVKAHQYYEEYTKKNKLKGRNKTSSSDEDEYSTSMLNDEGKMAYKQIKEALANEKKSTIETSKASRDATVKSNSESLSSQLKSNSESLKNQLASNNEKLKNDIASEREKTDKEIESFAQQQYTQIEQIRNTITRLKKNGSKGELESQQNKIYNLRKQTAEKKAELNNAYSNTSVQLKESNKTTAENLRSENKETAASIRSSSKASSESARSEHSSTTKKANEDYKTKAKEELKKLVDSGEFKVVKKKSTKKSSN